MPTLDHRRLSFSRPLIAKRPITRLIDVHLGVERIGSHFPRSTVRFVGTFGISTAERSTASGLAD
jgi:hypothetical protein